MIMKKTPSTRVELDDRGGTSTTGALIPGHAFDGTAGHLLVRLLITTAPTVTAARINTT